MRSKTWSDGIFKIGSQSPWQPTAILFSTKFGNDLQLSLKANDFWHALPQLLRLKVDQVDSENMVYNARGGTLNLTF
jgi:hypothetical protein